MTTDEMATKLMAWKLPKDFNPDGGVSFDKAGKNFDGFPHEWPIGTNLLTHEQAKAMFEFILGENK